MTVAQRILIDALDFYLEMLEEDPIPRTENKDYDVADVRAVLKDMREHS